jgi:hypothetical protein
LLEKKNAHFNRDLLFSSVSALRCIQKLLFYFYKLTTFGRGKEMNKIKVNKIQESGNFRKGVGIENESDN